MRHLSFLLVTVSFTVLPSCAVGVDDASVSNPWEPADGSIGGQAGAGGSSAEGGPGGSGGAAGWPSPGGASAGGEAGIDGDGGYAGTAGYAGVAGGVAGGAAGGAGGCVPGEVMDLGGCGDCGTLQRTCDANGMWGEPVCTGQGICSPGNTEEQDCGNCGLKSRSCGNDCTWGTFGACQAQGTCAPGEQRDCMCSTYGSTTKCCGEEVCNNNCQWDACGLKPTSACDWEAGTNFRCCAAGRWEYCLSSCNWSGNCAACTGCGC